MAGRLRSGPEASLSSSCTSCTSSTSFLSPDSRGGLTGESVNEEKEPITRAQLRINVISCWHSLERPRRLGPEPNQDQHKPFPFSHPQPSPLFFHPPLIFSSDLCHQKISASRSWVGYSGDFCGQRAGKKTKGMRSGRKGREERSALQTAVFGAQRSVYHVILKLILWLLQFLTQWEFWQSKATKWPPHKALMTYWDDWHCWERSRHPATKKKNEQKVPCTCTVGVHASSQLLPESFFHIVVLGRCLEENKGLHTLRGQSRKKVVESGSWRESRRHKQRRTYWIPPASFPRRFKIAS